MDGFLEEAALPRSTGEYTGRMEVGRALRSAPGMRPMFIHHLTHF
jgi:hypothetical protein